MIVRRTDRTMLAAHPVKRTFMLVCARRECRSRQVLGNSLAHKQCSFQFWNHHGISGIVSTLRAAPGFKESGCAAA